MGGGSSVYFAVIAGGDIVGGINLVKSGDEYSWGLFFKPQTSSFLVSACVFSFLEFAFTRAFKLNALVKNINEVALKFDQTFGFIFEKSDEVFSYLSQNKKQWQEHKKTKIMQKIAKTSKEFDIEILE
ncbi:hypothetical protein [Campylobacter mucosalis]|uniref:hypothetical protein n=1 Tax=Campylobacter mucosalis TaxID=202 RepID=UPI00147011ED|nr:hypothetical protein [Campylobacter mucosalis]